MSHNPEKPPPLPPVALPERDTTEKPPPDYTA